MYSVLTVCRISIYSQSQYPCEWTNEHLKWVSQESNSNSISSTGSLDRITTQCNANPSTQTNPSLESIVLQRLSPQPTIRNPQSTIHNLASIIPTPLVLLATCQVDQSKNLAISLYHSPFEVSMQVVESIIYIYIYHEATKAYIRWRR